MTKINYSALGLHSRQIGETDITTVATLLTRGFPKRNREFWLQALAQLSAREPPRGLPKYGYLMESDGAAVGVILLISSTIRTGDVIETRCNLSSWYVEPPYRAYASLFVSHALRHKEITYLNVSPAPHTQPIIESQGFSRYCDGIFIAVPMFNGLFDARATVYSAHRKPEVDFDPFEQKILLEHAAHGAISLWCATPEHAFPFVFRTRLLKAIIPCVQLIFCRDEKDFVRFAGPIGRFFALHGKPLVMLDANGPVPGLVGKYFPGRMPKYFKGPRRPQLGDLAYTEYALLGV